MPTAAAHGVTKASGGGGKDASRDGGYVVEDGAVREQSHVLPHRALRTFVPRPDYDRPARVDVAGGEPPRPGCDDTRSTLHTG